MTWTKGQSGNPSGRPSATAEVRALAREHTADAIAALVAALTDPKQRVAAAVALLDRGYGRPVQAIEASGPEGGPIVNETRHSLNLAVLSDDEVETLERLRAKAAGDAGSPAVQ